MSIKKVFTSKDGMAIIRQSDNQNKFPIGFEYSIGGVIYKVVEDITKDPGSSMRKVSCSNGDVEFLAVESIENDLREVDAVVINDGLPKKENPENEIQK